MPKKNDITIKIKGIESVADVLANKSPKDAINISRAAMQGMASTGKDYCREFLKPHQDSKTLYRAIKSKRMKSNPLTPTSAVVVQSNTHHPWYWVFLENGTQQTPATHFIRKTKQRLEDEQEQILEESLKKVLIKRIKKNLKSARK